MYWMAEEPVKNEIEGVINKIEDIANYRGSENYPRMLEQILHDFYKEAYVNGYSDGYVQG